MSRGAHTVESGIDLILVAINTDTCPHCTEVVSATQDGLDLRYRTAVCFNKTCHMWVDAVPRQIMDPGPGIWLRPSARSIISTVGWSKRYCIPHSRLPNGLQVQKILRGMFADFFH